MNKHKIVLKINKDSHLEIKNCYHNKDHICQYDRIEFFFVIQNKKYKLYDKIILGDLWIFRNMLQKALNADIQLNNSIQTSVGFIWNESLQSEEDTGPQYFDVVNYYSLWGSSSKIKYSTWIYNKNHRIHIEISPNYPWHFLKPKKNQKYISYEQWKKSFKPLFEGEVNRQMVQEWVKEINQVLTIMKQDEKNHSKK